MNNFEKLKSMTISELTAWLNEYSQFDDSPWATWFNDTYCSKCKSIECVVDEKETLFPGLTIKCAYCEIEKKCRFFEKLETVPDTRKILELWLIQAVTE